MKKILTTIVMMAIMAIMLPLAANAQTRGRRYYTNRSSATQSSAPSYVYNRPSFYHRHRNAVNVAAGTGAGLILGGLIGGRRGAGIGALLGAGGSALYTYKIKPKRRRY